ncbi:MAG: hypothetical protein OXG25_04405 [Gammaproteobacteria bacterium]|nr:hypothetical protein [Gammaproteobacteria bacterium]
MNINLGCHASALWVDGAAYYHYPGLGQLGKDSTYSSGNTPSSEAL